MGEEDEGYSQFDQDDLILKQDRAKSLLENGQLQESIVMLEEITSDYPEFGQLTTTSHWHIFMPETFRKPKRRFLRSWKKPWKPACALQSSHFFITITTGR